MVITNNLKKYVKSLHTLKYRQKYNKFIAEGLKICMEFLISEKFNIEYIFCTEQALNELQFYINKHEEKTIVCNHKDLKSISALKTPNNILIVFETNLREVNSFNLNNDWAFYLDKIQDPGNMGTIMRIADWYGISNVVSSLDSVDIYNPKVVQSAMGAHNRVKSFSIDRDAFLEKFKNEMVVLNLKGEPIEKVLKQNDLHSGVLVIGNESRGASEDIISQAKYQVLIPRFGGAESLNASVACGIAAHVIRSQ